VDGGILNPVPSNVVARMGADLVIAVKLASQGTPAGADAEAVVSAGRVPSVLQAITRSIELMQSKIVSEAADKAAILLEPATDSAETWGLRNFSQGRRFISAGEAAVELALPRIAAALPG